MELSRPSFLPGNSEYHFESRVLGVSSFPIAAIHDECLVAALCLRDLDGRTYSVFRFPHLILTKCCPDAKILDAVYPA
ncbi:hypothetical protein PISMIDRAFT_684084 [Pisolithus microcarpus 441]|uniref:Uncharacterized protein n=1 Tax=Pisolithus microcarpus 441 TaxID=765257 RepID=A0A0C9ZF02_9AGAM|nr:hypothetical protein PISMIDRAFT_684084 [Pisolithus microcarpus 441]